MKAIVALSFIVAGAIALSGCNDPKDASESNFKAAAQQYLDTTYPECYFKVNFPFKTDGFDFGNTRAVLKALAAKGLLTETEISRKHYEKSWGSEAHDVVVNNYALTDEGKKYYKAGTKTNALGKETGGFCFGKAKVETITNFTEPSDAMGQKISRVNYTYTVTDIPEWAKSDDIIAASTKLKEDVASEQNPVSAKGVFVLTNKGWMHERLFSKR